MRSSARFFLASLSTLALSASCASTQPVSFAIPDTFVTREALLTEATWSRTGNIIGLLEGELRCDELGSLDAAGQAASTQGSDASGTPRGTDTQRSAEACLLARIAEYAETNGRTPSAAWAERIGPFCGFEHRVTAVAYCDAPRDEDQARCIDRTVRGWAGTACTSAKVSSATGVARTAFLYQANVRILAPLRIVDDTRVEIEGKLLHHAGRLEAYINQGTHGAARCDVHRGPTSEFAVSCPFSIHDPWTLVELHAPGAGRHWYGPIARWVVARPGIHPTLPSRPLPTGFVASNDPARDLLGLASAFRREASSPPLGEAVEQSEDLRSLLAEIGGEPGHPRTREHLAEYVADGWHVAMPAREARVALLGQRGGDDPLDWARGLLEEPGFRFHMLAPEVEQWALVNTRCWDDAAGVLIGAYVRFDPSAAEDDAFEILQRINARRRERGLVSARRMTEMEGIRQILEAHAERRITRDQARIRAVSALGRMTLRPFHYWLVDYVPGGEFPGDEVLLAPSNRHLVIEVAYVRPTTAALGHYLLFLAYMD